MGQQARAPWYEPARQSSLLTPALRRYLLDTENFREENSDAYLSQVRTRLRRRLASGLLDFRILFRHYPDNFYRRLLTDEISIPREHGSDEEPLLVNVDGNRDDSDVEGLEAYLVDAYGLLYRSGLAAEDDPDAEPPDAEVLARDGFPGPHGYANREFVRAAGEGIERAIARRGEFAQATLSVELEHHYRQEELKPELLADESERVLRDLLNAGKISPEEYSRAVLNESEGGEE